MDAYKIDIDTQKARRDVDNLAESFEKLADVIDRINRGLRIMNELNKETPDKIKVKTLLNTNTA